MDLPHFSQNFPLSFYSPGNPKSIPPPPIPAPRRKKQKNAIISHLETQLKAQTGQTYYTVITFDPASFNRE